MTFLRPWALAALLLIPVVVALYFWRLHRKRRGAVRYASLSLIREALPRRSRWRRHLPFALLLLTVASLVVATARPQASRAVPLSRTTILLALDVSRSMCSTDVDPNRLTAAQAAARQFVEHLPSDTQVGIVAFASIATTVVAPTTNTQQLVDAINKLTTSIGTVIGGAILASIDDLARVNPSIAPSTLNLTGGTDANPPPTKKGYEPDIIVLLTDGANSRGVSPVIAAQQAVDRKVRIYTIGFGTTNPGPLVCSPQQLGAEGLNDPFAGGPNFGNGGPPGGFPRQFIARDEPTLKTVASMTGGAYYSAENSDELAGVFRDLPSRVKTQKEQQEISAIFVLVGAFLAAVAVGLSLWWNRYP